MSLGALDSGRSAKARREKFADQGRPLLTAQAIIVHHTAIID